MNCEPPAKKGSPAGPDTWETSCRSIEGFCSRVLNAGYAATLFLSARAADEHAPLVEELAGRGVELGLYLHPPHLGDHRFSKHLGTYGEQEQHELIAYAVDWYSDALDARPQSFRPGDFSANETTFGVLYALGFRQGSLSNPGRDAPRQGVRWSGAPSNAHYVDPTDRQRAGALPFLEVPVTSDPTTITLGGLTPALCIESGDFEHWHRPIIARRLAQMEAERADFRTLCIFTHNRFAYDQDDLQYDTLDAMVAFFDSLRHKYEIAPVTVAGAHTAWLRRT